MNPSRYPFVYPQITPDKCNQKMCNMMEMLLIFNNLHYACMEMVMAVMLGLDSMVLGQRIGMLLGMLAILWRRRKNLRKC